MRRLCIIGNSQVGALKLGLDRLRRRGSPLDHEIRFWGIPGGQGPDLRIENQRILISEDSCRKLVTNIDPFPGQELDLSGFDAVLLSGIGIPAIRQQNNTPSRHYLAAGFIQDSVGTQQVISRAVFQGVICHALHSLASFQNIDRVGQIFDGPIYIQHFPLPTADVVQREDFDLPYGPHLGRFLSWYYQQQIQCLEHHIATCNARLIPYPEAWIQSGFTPSHYSDGRDAWHMNGEFGQYVLESLWAML